MDYKIVQQLKKVGFPFDFRESIMGDDTYTYPTIDQLLKELGDDFETLEKTCHEEVGKWWRAYMTEEKFDEIDDYGCVVDCCGYEIGDTPQEALANLYIRLNE